jgi:hypothetical protein
MSETRITWNTETINGSKAQRGYVGGLRFTTYRSGRLVIATTDNELVYEAQTATQAGARAIANAWVASR